MSKVRDYLKKPNEEAQNAFILNINKLSERIKELSDYVENHMGYDPEEINWGHVGVSEHFLKELTELTDMAYNRGEYSKAKNGN